MSATKAASRALALTVVVLALGASATPAGAVTFALRDFLHLGRKEPDDRVPVPQTAAYESDGGSQFVFDQSWQLPLIRFQDSHEVMVLHGVRTVRGDIIYRDDTEEPMLRLTNVGGFTLLYNARPGGEAVSLVGDAQELRLTPIRAAILFRILAQASLRASHVSHHLVAFEAPDVTAGSEAVYADSASIVADVMSALSQRKNGASVLKKVQQVQLRQSGKVGASFKSGVLNISLNPAKGLAGRPSSHKVMGALH